MHVDPLAPTPSFVVVDTGLVRLASIVGEPDVDLVRSAVRDSEEVLAAEEAIAHARRALPDWTAERAIMHVLASPAAATRAPAHVARYLDPSEVVALDHLDPLLAAELEEAAEDDVPIVAAFDGSRPVAFCYAGARTESLWDVAIDTVESHRRRGYASSAALRLIRDYAGAGLAPVWGALESNAASLGLARALGFTPMDTLWVLSRR